MGLIDKTNPTKGAIYYTDNRPKQFILDACQEQISKACALARVKRLVSVSLKPIDFGHNIVLTGYERSYPTMVRQITTALGALDTDIVFFLEHDVLYHPSHFDFTPERDDLYYYNVNNWRWELKEEYAITYDNLKSLSQMCCYRKTALKHYQGRLKLIEDKGYDKVVSREAKWVRNLGYEPGTKPRRKGGFSDETYETWRSELPNIDIRHRHTFSPPKTHIEHFKHPPMNWQERKIDEIPYWDLRKLHDEWIGQYLIR